MCTDTEREGEGGREGRCIEQQVVIKNTSPRMTAPDTVIDQSCLAKTGGSRTGVNRGGGRE